MTESGYIQGAGDDHESWAYGLTPALFWENKDRLLTAVEEDLCPMIHRIISDASHVHTMLSEPIHIGETGLYIGALQDTLRKDVYDGIIICSENLPQDVAMQPQERKRTTIFHFPCSDGKLGSRALRTHLPKLPAFISALATHKPSPKILCACSTGRDLAVGVVLAIMCLCCNESGKSRSNYCNKNVDKALISRNLAYILTLHPAGNPSRATLQSVKAFLMPKDA